MIITLWICAALAVGLGYTVGANVKRAFYESRLEELEAQRSALNSVNANLRFELSELQGELEGLVDEVAAPETVEFCSSEESAIIQRALGDAEQETYWMPLPGPSK